MIRAAIRQTSFRQNVLRGNLSNFNDVKLSRYTVSRYFSSTAILKSDDTCIVLISVKRYYRFQYNHCFTLSKTPF